MDQNEIAPINRNFLRDVSEVLASVHLPSKEALPKLLQEQITDETGGEDE